MPDDPPTRARYTLRLQQVPGPNPEWKDMKISEKVIEKDPTKDSLLMGEHQFFLDSLKTGHDLISTVLDSYKALEIVYAAKESIKTGKIIHPNN